MLKRTRKTVIAICVMLVAILAGMFLTNQTDVVYASDLTVNTKALSVKCQLPTNATMNDDSTSLRLVSTVRKEDVAQISYVGFEICFIADDDGSQVNMLDLNNTVYGGIKIDSARADGVTYDFTPKVFDASSEYFSTCTIHGIPSNYYDNGILIKPFVVEIGNNPKVEDKRVYGEHRYIKIADVLDTDNKMMSIPVAGDVSSVASGTLGSETCSLDSTPYYDGSYTHVRIAKDFTTLPSVTKLTVSGQTATYRNLYSTVENDTSWHTDGVGGVIVTVGDLQGFESLAQTNETYEYETVYLASDIDLNPGWSAGTTVPSKTWTPIKKFAGVFDGGECTIQGVYVVKSAAVAGFIHETTSAAEVKNFALKNSYISVTGVTDAAYAGGVVGIDAGATYENLYTDVTIASDGLYLGGIIGVNITAPVTIKNCWNAGDIVGLGDTTANPQIAGGIIGTSDFEISISNSLNTGTIGVEKQGNQIGGICGRILKTGEISNCVNLGTVNAYPGNSKGAIVGNPTAVTLDNVYSLTSGGTATGNGKDGTQLADANLKSDTAYTNTGLDPLIWEYVENGYPEIRSYSEADSKLSWYLQETEDEVTYKITEKAELYGFEYFSKKDNFSGDTVRLTQGVKFEDGEAWTPISTSNLPFAGTFDGNDKKIVGMNVTSTGNFNGFFIATKGATIQDLTLTGAMDLSVGSYSGGLIGWSQGDTNITNVSVDVNVDATGFYVGGLIGYHQGGNLNISKADIAGDITNTTSGNDKYGGFIGAIAADSVTKISNSAFSGTVTNTGHNNNGGYIGYAQGTATVNNSTLSGTVTGAENIGGFIGNAVGSVAINNCNSTGTVSGTTKVGGVCGYSTGAVTVQNTEVDGSVTVTGKYAGGFVGQADKALTFSESAMNADVTGTYSGGFAGIAKGTIEMSECMFNGKVTSKDLSGGFFGTIESGSNQVNIKHCLFGKDGQTVLTGNQRGGMVGRITSGTVAIDDCLILGKTNVENLNWYSLLVGFSNSNVTITNTFINETEKLLTARCGGGTLTDSSVVFTAASYLTGANAYANTNLNFNDYWNAVSGGYPELKAFATSNAMTLDANTVRADYSWYVRINDLSGELTSTYIVEDARDLVGVSVISKMENFAGDTVQLGADIDLSPVASWTPISPSNLPFEGTFDGNSKKITGMNVSSTGNFNGFFIATKGATVQNLTLTGAMDLSVGSYSGGLIGWSQGNTNITNVSVDVNVDATGFYVGGLIGYHQGGNLNISKANIAGDITNTTSGNDKYGGFIGAIAADSVTEISASTFSGTVTNIGHNNNGGYIGYVSGTATVNNSALTGTVKGAENIGGFIGNAVGSVAINNCNSTGTVSGTTKVGGVCGYSTGAVTVQSTEVDGSVAVTGKYAGGFVGQADKALTFSESAMNADITGTYSGGFAGLAKGTIEMSECMFNGKVTSKDLSGGFFGTIESGSNQVNIKHCLFGKDGKTVLTGNQRGGMIGRIATGTVAIDDCLILGETNVENLDWYSLLVGLSRGNVNITNTFVNETEKLVSARYNAGTLTDSSVVFTAATYLTGANAHANTSLNFNDYWNAVSGGYPELKAFATNNAMTLDANTVRPDFGWYVRTNYVSGDLVSSYIVEDASDLVGVSVISKMENFANDTVKLGADIDLSAVTAWSPIANADYPFAGTFNGNSKNITGMKVTATGAWNGLFSYVTDASIQNFTLQGTVTGGSNNGGLIGQSSGNTEITGVNVDVDVSATGFHNGGLVGYQAAGTLTVTDSACSGVVTNSAGTNDKYGGLIGATAKSTTTNLNECSYTGTVTNTKKIYTGGFIGYAEGNVYVDGGQSAGTVNGISYTGGVIGCCTNATSIKNLAVSGKVTSVGFSVGGLVGANNGTLTIDNVDNSCIISNTTTNPEYGGFVGTANVGVEITNSTYSGTLTNDKAKNTGGFIGKAVSTVTLTSNNMTGTVNGKDYTGGYIGVAQGTSTITDNTNTGTVTCGSYSGGVIGHSAGTETISDVYVNATVSSTGICVGGFIGNKGAGTVTVTNSANAGNIASTSTDNATKVGGFIGFVAATDLTDTVVSFNSCMNSGDISGYRNFVSGFVGSSDEKMSFENCLNTGVITNTDTETAEPISYAAAAFATLMADTKVVNCYALKTSEDDRMFRQLTKYAKGFSIQLSTEELQGSNGYFYTNLPDESWNFSEDGYPELEQFTTRTETDSVKKTFPDGSRYDTGWYGDGTADTFTLTDAGDLYGFTQMSHDIMYRANIQGFIDKTIQLGATITVNEGTAAEMEERATDADASNDPITWIPIGDLQTDVDKGFAGTFDGQNYTIKGLYRKSDVMLIALFTETTSTSVVQNLKMEDCYFHYNGFEVKEDDGYLKPGFVASVAAYGNGQFKNIYSSATIISEGNCAGGIVASVCKEPTSENHILEKCWFDGTVTLQKHANSNATPSNYKQYAFFGGGILGQVTNTDIVCHMKNCLNTGTVTGSYNYVGGLCGYVADGGKLVIKNSMNTGSVTGSAVTSSYNPEHMQKVCSIVGLVEAEIKNKGTENEKDQRSSLTLANVYSQAGVAYNDTFFEEYSGSSYEADKDKYISGYATVLTHDKLLGENAISSASALFETEGIWKIVNDGTPILYFAWK